MYLCARKVSLKGQIYKKKNLQTKNSAHNGTTFTKVSYICKADEVKAVGRNARSIKTLFHW